MKPQRIQLKRTRGWRMPANTVKVDRTTAFGNPFVVAPGMGIRRPDGRVAMSTAEQAVEAFRAWATTRAAEEPGWLETLRGKNLACWCKLPAEGEPDVCHAAVLIELANREDGTP